MSDSEVPKAKPIWHDPEQWDWEFWGLEDAAQVSIESQSNGSVTLLVNLSNPDGFAELAQCADAALEYIKANPHEFGLKLDEPEKG